MTDHLKQRDGDQPLPIRGREPVQDALIKAIEERRDLGIRRYGSPLMTHNGRDALQDAWEEAIDLAAHLTQMRMERADPVTGFDVADFEYSFAELHPDAAPELKMTGTIKPSAESFLADYRRAHPECEFVLYRRAVGHWLPAPEPETP